METERVSGRHFLGWERMPLEAAGAWITDELGPDLSRVVIALPGARGGRLLQEALATAAAADGEFRAPKVVTAGTLSDALLELQGRTAGRMARTLAWTRALRGLDEHSLASLAARPPEPDDLDGWWKLAERVRGLFGELAAETLRFEDVAADGLLQERPGERRRWEALARAQEAMQAELAAHDLADPHLERLRAIEEGWIVPRERIERVVLVGIGELKKLACEALEASAAQLTSLVFAPEELEASFDELGCLRPQEWARRDVSLDLERWHVVDRPGDQARTACAVMAGWEGRFSADEITVGLADPEVAPFVQRQLAQEEVRARDAAGRPLGLSGPLRLVELAAAFLRSQRYGELAELVRHADFEGALRRDLPGSDPVADVDEYFRRHLPSLVDGTWSAASDGQDASKDGALRGRMRALWSRTQELFGPLWSNGSLGLGQATESLRAFLGAVYDEPFERGEEGQRATLYALERIGTALAELEELPADFDPRGGGAQAMELVLRALEGEVVPPVPAREEEQTIEMLGWFELPLDNAPALVVVGFEEGRVPESVRGDAFLPDRLRKSLGLEDNERRLARDAYATELLLHSRERVAFISGRRHLSGDPQLPSRIAFQRPPEELPERVRAFLGGAATPRASIEDQSPSFELPCADASPVESMRVTDFKLFLDSPYSYYLRRVLKLDTVDDSARELEPMAFGILAHTALERFGLEPKLRDTTDEKAIARFLIGELEQLADELYGRHPLPAVRLQLRQLDARMRTFAARQAERASQGWRIFEVEWGPGKEGVPLLVDGTPMKLTGRIDRIDRRGAGKDVEYAVWDYKTSEGLTPPLKAHRKADGSWRDLQLPLYCFLVQDLCGERMPTQMGYVALCRNQHELGFYPVDTWSRKKGEFEGLEEGVADAYETAEEVVRRIRRGEFFEREGFTPREPILAAIGGTGLVEGLTEGDEE